jgi:hypothetical protein
MPVRKEIIYPIFLECCKYTEDDDFWKYIFEDLAYGKCPYRTYIRHNYLCCKMKDREFSYRIDNTRDAKIVYKEIYNLFYDKAGILSELDLERKKLYFESIEKNIQEIRASSWSAIKKKSIKEQLIEDFVISMKQKYNLSFSQTKKLSSVISIGIIFKLITSQDINYENGEIQSIDCISFDNKKISITRTVQELELPPTQEIVYPKKLMSSNWEKYIENLRKLINK